MFALTLDYDTRLVSMRETPMPRIEREDEVRFRVREVGLCGSDRLLASFAKGRPPEGESRLILGHEALGVVESVGPQVKGMAPGDWVAPVIRRRCPGPCASCDRGRSDLCLTGLYTERGLHGAHGYFCDFAVDSEHHLVRVPADLAGSAVLLEPLSVVEKAIDAALRAHDGKPETAVILGAGSIGLLTAFALIARGIRVTVKSLEPASSPRVALLRQAGAEYVTTAPPQADLVFEASGANESAFEAVRLLAPCGVALILGAMNSTGDFPFRDLILGNRKVIGIVNSSRQSFEAAIDDLRRFDPRVVAGLIERRPRWEAVESLNSAPPQAVKLVHTLED